MIQLLDENDKAQIEQKIKTVSDETNSLKEDLTDKIDKPTTEDNDKFPRAKNGNIEWVEHGLPTDEQTDSAVTNWLNEHPEAIKTVQDKSLTATKFTDELRLHTLKDYVTPEMFGAIGDGVSDDSEAFIKAIKYVVDNSSYMNSDRDSYVSHVIVLGSKKYKIAQNNLLSGISKNIYGLTMIGYGTATIDFYGNGDLFNDHDKMINTQFEGITFLGNDNNQILLNRYSAVKSQDTKFIRCNFVGKWKYIVNLTGYDLNSEMIFSDCRMGGSWDSFLYSGSQNTSDQFLNYWFDKCKYWSSSNAITMYKGGHITLNACDFSGYQPSVDTFLFSFPEGTHSYGVQSFNDFGSRYEIKTSHAKVLYCAEDSAQVNFYGCDFSSQMLESDKVDKVFHIHINGKNMSVYNFDCCKLYGGFKFTGNDYIGGSQLFIHNCTLYYPFIESNPQSFFEYTSPYCPAIFVQSCKSNGDISNKIMSFEIGNLEQACIPIKRINKNPDKGSTLLVYPLSNENILHTVNLQKDYADNGYNRSLYIVSKIGTINSINNNTIELKKVTNQVELLAEDNIFINGVVYEVSSLTAGINTISITLKSAPTALIGDDVSIVFHSFVDYIPLWNPYYKSKSIERKFFEPLYAYVSSSDPSDNRAYCKIDIMYS